MDDLTKIYLQHRLSQFVTTHSKVIQLQILAPSFFYGVWKIVANEHFAVSTKAILSRISLSHCLNNPVLHIYDSQTLSLLSADKRFLRWPRMDFPKFSSIQGKPSVLSCPGVAGRSFTTGILLTILGKAGRLVTAVESESLRELLQHRFLGSTPERPIQ